MNENPVGTPNPLNPNPLDANPSEPMEETNQQPVLDEPVREEPTPTPLTEELVNESVMVNSLDPEGRPMEKAPETTAPVTPKKKKTGLIVGLVACLFVAVCCGVAAILMMLNSANDPASAAVEKLLKGEIPANVSIEGTIGISANDPKDDIASANITLNSQIKTGSMVNASSANINLALADGKEYSLTLSEVYADSQDLYLKLEQEEQKLEVLENTEESLTETNCVGDESGMTNCGAEVEVVTEEGQETETVTSDDFSATLNGIISQLGGRWIRIPVAESDWLISGLTTDNEVTCLINAIQDVNLNSNSIASVYSKNPFVSSTTENITINSKLNPVRQIVIDSAKFTNYVNTIQSTPAATAINTCLGVNENTEITVDDAKALISKIPALYVEINSDNTFSRLYTTLLSDDGNYTITVDLSFTYPTGINISEPNEYTDIQEILQSIMGFEEGQTEVLEMEYDDEMPSENENIIEDVVETE